MRIIQDYHLTPVQAHVTTVVRAVVRKHPWQHLPDGRQMQRPVSFTARADEVQQQTDHVYVRQPKPDQRDLLIVCKCLELSVQCLVLWALLETSVLLMGEA